MMTNLFSSFDPSTSMSFSLNWMSTMLGLMFIPLLYWALPNRMTLLIMNMNKTLYNEFKMLLGYNSKGISLIFISVFTYILMNNMLGLLPYVFTSSSHLSFSLSLALPLWLSLMIFGWLNKSQDMLAHLVPKSTPPMLMPFMVVIETVSNLIRPGSLAVRLTANMIAGHLLMTLLGNNMVEAQPLVMLFIIFVQMGLMMFEVAVSIIQAYVFSILTTLYSSEVSYE